MSARPAYLRLSLYYFFFFAALGSFVPYWSVYLDHLQFSAIEIGQLMAVFMVTKLIAPFALGWLADHYGNRIRWIQLSAFLAVIGFIPIFLGKSYLWIVVSVTLGGFFWNASLSQFEAVTLNHLGDKASRYTWVRLWGSIGFIIAVLCLPLVFDRFTIDALPFVIITLFTFIWMSSLLVADREHHEPAGSDQDIHRLIKHPMVIAFMVACVFQTISHGAYYTFFSIYLDGHGYSKHFIGWMWALGVIAEVVLFIFLYRLFEHHKTYKLFAVSLLLTVIRWLLLGFYVDSMSLLLVAQLLHAASFGLFHASAIHLIHEWFPGRLQGRGQALYAGLSFGLGGAIGSVVSGYLWEYSTSTITFSVMALLAFIGWFVVVRNIRSSRLW